MADLLTHVLVPFVLLTPLRWRLDWLSKRWIVLAMAGAAIPDLVKIDLVLDNGVIQTTLGVPFSYDPISTLGGVLVIAGAIALCFGEARRRVYGYLVFGGLASLVLDGLRVFVDGQANFWLYPFVWRRPPTPSLYVSSDPRGLAVTLAVSALVFLLDRYRDTWSEKYARSGI
ncbi:hypothetical protein BRC91_10605 [Halobacteriales archaeon QS_4_62_28]|nr:MAG: hypothetical protein BRC91_10605 [Halobacteriales archaeon QS_4_62_28]